MTSNPLCTPNDHRISRRELLGGMSCLAATVFGGGSLAGLADEPPKIKDKQVLFVWIDGGMSQLESWDPKPNTPFGGPFRPISTSVPGVQFSELLPRSARHMQHLVVVRNMATHDNSHSAGVPRIQRGDPKNRGVTYPFFGSAIAKLMGPGSSKLPPYVWIKPGNGGFIHADGGFLGPQYGALAFGDGKPPENILRNPTVSEDDDAIRNALRENANKRYATARRPEVNAANSYVYEMARKLMQRQDLFDTASFDPKDVERYGTHEFGRHMLQARKMLEAGVRFVKVNSYGWDTHGDNFIGHRNLMPKFDQGFAAMIEDLAVRGMLDNVLVIAMSEFGRTPRINGHVGRDHWPEAWSLVMSGCGLKQGVVVGKTNANGTDVDGQGYDIGHLFHTWFQALGIKSDEIEYDNHGQPLPIAHDDCFAVKEALA